MRKLVLIIRILRQTIFLYDQAAGFWDFVDDIGFERG